MADMTCKQVATLTGGKWDKCLESNRRVYSTENVSPTITTCGGGGYGSENLGSTDCIRRAKRYIENRRNSGNYYNRREFPKT